MRREEYWRSIADLAGTMDQPDWSAGEAAARGALQFDPLSRRRFLQLLGASLALAGLAGCSAQLSEQIVPYVKAPAEIVPGKPLFFASATSLGGYGLGVLVESNMGRPTKVEGNPGHPASLGATDSFAQASVLTLYDPDRSKNVLRGGQVSTWDQFLTTFRGVVAASLQSQGDGLSILTETVTSPTLAHQLTTLLAQLPKAKWHRYDPVGRDNVRAGDRLAFGEDVATRYRFDQADVIFSLEADFLYADPGRIRYAKDFSSRRRAETEAARMSRLYVVESTPTVTGSVADHRLPVRSADIERVARAVAADLGVPVDRGPGAPAGVPPQWLAALVGDLQAHRGAGIVLAGDQQPPVVHALAHAMNQVLGNAGKTVIYTDPVEANPADQLGSLRDLVENMAAGRVNTLLILGGNPVYTAPADFSFGQRLAEVGLSIHLSLFEDETSARCDWHLPAAHELEAWSDVRAFDGTVSIVQPLIAPLYGGRSDHELLAAFTDQPVQSGLDIVREYWRNQLRASDFEQVWRTALHDGFIDGTAVPARSPTLTSEPLPAFGEPSGANAGTTGLEIVFRPDPTIYDGRFANNGWLQELPKPLTKLTWDNAALISPATAQRLGLDAEDVVELHLHDRTVRAPIFVVPGQADDSVTVHFGYGRERAGKVGSGTGFNAYQIRTSNALWFGNGLTIRKTGDTYPLATTQRHHRMEGRAPVEASTVQQLQDNPQLIQERTARLRPDQSLYPGYRYDGYAWGMAIDLSACIGCQACVIACQAENNIPVVGKDQVQREREMHWLRVDSYFQGDPANPTTYHQPVPCMQCENAPCELVCPVGATVHSDQGLNDMVYNRCVGTRYCSNNCPYKVRRFNFLQYADWTTPSLKLLRNPEVTVRSRGVMEKCTYCVQRIRAAEIQAKKEGRPVRDGEILTACQAVCPTNAIVFGNINDASSAVARLKAGPLNYALLGDLNTRPRTTYLASLRNPNPTIEAE